MGGTEESQRDECESHGAASPEGHSECGGQSLSGAVGSPEVGLRGDHHAHSSADDGNEGSDGEGEGGHEFLLGEEGDDEEHDDYEDEADQVFLLEELDGALGGRRGTLAILSPSSMRSLRCSSVTSLTSWREDSPWLLMTLMAFTCRKLKMAQAMPSTQLTMITTIVVVKSNDP